ncbi:MAG: hypothetical protein ACK2U9_10530 [Anaerolineae bacterium]
MLWSQHPAHDHTQVRRCPGGRPSGDADCYFYRRNLHQRGPGGLSACPPGVKCGHPFWFFGVAQPSIYHKCITTRAPEAARPAMLQSLRAMADVWRRAASTEAGQHALACGQGMMV